MARIGINVNVNDLTRAGAASVRRSLRRIQHQLNGLDTRANLTINTRGAAGDIRRVRRLVNQLPNNTVVRVRVRAPHRSETNRFRNTLTAPFRQSGRVLGGILSDGIGQGIIGGFQKAGPVGIAAFAAILLAAMAVLGAAMAGTLVLAFGAGLVGLGVFFAMKSKEMEATWGKASKRMRDELSKAAEPLEPVIKKAIGAMEGAVDAFAPKLRQFFIDAIPQIETFGKAFREGFRKLGAEAWKPLTDAFRVFLDAFGPQWEGFMQDLGESFGALGRTVSSHSTEIAMALRAVLQLIVGLVDIVNFLARTWAVMLRVATAGFGYLIKYGISPLFDSIMFLATGAVKLFAKAFGWIPGLGPKLKAASKNFDNWAVDISEKLEGAGDDAINFGKKLDRANKMRQLRVDIQTWKARLQEAREKLKKTTDQKARAKLTADISDLRAKIRAARGDLNGLNGKIAKTYIVSYRVEGGKGQAYSRATGGITPAVRGAATGGLRGNMTMVGEQGPEMVNLPPGAHVRSNSDTRRILSANRQAPMATLRLEPGTSDMGRLLMRILRESIRVEGGDVQVVLGS